MTEAEALAKLIPPGQKRPWKKANRQGIIQIIVTSSCDKACPNCTQLANIKRPHWEMSPEDFEIICKSLEGYWGVVACFGGNPCVAKNFPHYCDILTRHFPKEQRGLWSNNLFGHGPLCRKTFGPHNLNVHGDKKAFDEIKRDWPEAKPFGLETASSHSPVFGNMMLFDKLPFPDGTYRENTEGNRWELISHCDLNYHWSGAATVVNNRALGYFCEVAAAQALYRQDHRTGIPITREYKLWSGEFVPWWKLGMDAFAHQAREHCHRCSVPLKGRGDLDSGTRNQITADYAPDFRPKRGTTEIVTTIEQLEAFAVEKVTEYRKNAH